MRTHRFVWLLAAFLGGAVSVPAQDAPRGSKAEAEVDAAPMRSVAVLAFKDVPSFRDRVREFLELSSQGNAAAEFTQLMTALSDSGGVLGLDSRRLIGIILQSDGGDLLPLTFLPARSDDGVLGLLGHFFPEKKDLGDSVYELSGGDTMYLRLSRSWGYLTPRVSSLDGLLPDPPSLVHPDAPNHDFSLTLRMFDFPGAYQGAMSDYLRQNTLLGAVRMPGESEAQFLGRMHGSQVLGVLAKRFLKGASRVLLSLDLSKESRTINAQVDVEARPGSALRETFGTLLGSRSRFSSLHDRTAVASLLVSVPLDSLIQQGLSSGLALVREELRDAHQRTITRQVETRDLMTKSWRAVERLLQVIEDKYREGNIDFVAKLLRSPTGAHVLVLACEMPGATDIGGWFEDVLPLYKEAGLASSFELGKTNHRGVIVHEVVPVLSEDSSAYLFGAEPQIQVGLGLDAFYLAFGEDCLGVLLSAIDQSLDGVATDSVASPIDLHISTGALTRLFSENGLKIGLFEAIRQRVGGDGRWALAVRPTSDGARLRCEFSENMLVFLGRLLVEDLLVGF